MPEEKNNNGQKPNFYQLYETVGQIKGVVDGIDKKLDNHDERINKVEEKTDQMLGRATGAGFIAGFFITAIGLIFTIFRR